MNIKKVELIVSPPEPHWVGDGFRVHNFIPSYFNLSMERMNPFILLDYNSKYNFPPSETPFGVGVHPHRGFETVTIAYQGKVQHHDSYGGGGIIGKGDVQWMTAASGVLHKEYHEKEWSKNGGDFQMVQLWVNLPSKFKMSAPKYQAIKNTDINKFYLDDNLGNIEVISGEYNGTIGKAETFTKINLFNAILNKGAKASFSFPSNFNTALLVVNGKININNAVDVDLDNFALFENYGENFIIKAIEDSIVLIMSGEPINEPIASHGPFVMNTREELIQAFNDFNKGKFGYLED